MSQGRVVYEDDDFTIMRRGSAGRANPPSIKVYAKKKIGRGHAFVNRRLEITLDELFTLTEALDDICDEIEDQEERQKALLEHSKAP